MHPTNTKITFSNFKYYIMTQLAFYINNKKVDRTIMSKLIYNLQKLKLMLFTNIKLYIYAFYAIY